MQQGKTDGGVHVLGGISVHGGVLSRTELIVGAVFFFAVRSRKRDKIIESLCWASAHLDRRKERGSKIYFEARRSTVVCPQVAHW